MTKTILFLITLCLAVNLSARDACMNQTVKERTLVCDTMSTDTFPRIRTTHSADNKVQVFTSYAKHNNRRYNLHEIRYDVAPGKMRCSSLQDHRYFGYVDYHSLVIDTVYHVSKDLYLLEGISQDNRYHLIPIHIGRGMARKAHVFPDKEDEIAIHFDPDKYAAQYLRARLDASTLRVPVGKASPFEGEYAQFEGEYALYHFNGAHYEDSTTYAKTLSKMQGGKEIITRVDWIDVISQRLLKLLPYPDAPFSMEVAVVSENEKIEDYLTLTLQSELEHEHHEGKLFNVKMSLKPINNTVIVENLCPYYFPIVDPGQPSDTLSSVLCTAGRDSAYPYEWLRYTAVIFNRLVKEEDHSLIRWALEVDGVLQQLEGDQWQGTQIDLQMQEEWLDKTIAVIPYIEGHPMNYEMAIKTKVIPYQMRFKDFEYYPKVIEEEF